MLIAKLDKRLTKLSRSAGKKFKRLERLSGEPAFCNPPSDVPKWAVDANNVESDHPSVSDVLEDDQVTELTEPLLSEPIELHTVMADQSNTVVHSESDSDFSILLECD